MEVQEDNMKVQEESVCQVPISKLQISKTNFPKTHTPQYPFANKQLLNAPSQFYIKGRDIMC